MLIEVAEELGISSESLRRWNQQAEIDEGQREGLSTEEQEELRRLSREVKTLRQQREFLKKLGKPLARGGHITYLGSWEGWM